MDGNTGVTAWKPLDVKIGDASVTDIYFGEEENFLANVTLWLKFDGNFAENFWQAGDGLIAQDADGYSGTQASDFLRAVADHLAQYPDYHDLTVEKLSDSLTDKYKDFTPILAAKPF